MPRATSKGVIVSKNGELIPAPAPWARTRRQSAFAGSLSVMSVRMMSYVVLEPPMLGSVIPLNGVARDVSSFFSHATATRNRRASRGSDFCPTMEYKGRTP